MRTTKSQSKYWADRRIDWKTSYLDTWEHPHRYLITLALNSFNWRSLMEIGVGGGANLKNIIMTLKNKQLGGIDVSKSAIEFCQKEFKGGVFKVGTAEDLFMSDKSADVLLGDMTYIYIGPFKIKECVRELARVARKQVVLCELHEPKWYKRVWMYFKTGYFFHNWPKLLKNQGFYNIIMLKLPKQAWPGGLQEKYAYIIKAKSPKRI